MESIVSTNWICKEPQYSSGSSFFLQHFLSDKRLQALSSAQWGCPRQSLFCSEKRGNSARPLGRMRDQCGRQIVQACNEPNSRGLPLHLQEQDHRQALWCILEETTQRSSFFLRVCSYFHSDYQWQRLVTVLQLLRHTPLVCTCCQALSYFVWLHTIDL